MEKSSKNDKLREKILSLLGLSGGTPDGLSGASPDENVKSPDLASSPEIKPASPEVSLAINNSQPSPAVERDKSKNVVEESSNNQSQADSNGDNNAVQNQEESLVESVATNVVADVASDEEGTLAGADDDAGTVDVAGGIPADFTFTRENLADVSEQLATLFEEAVAEARREGEIAGRNAKIEELMASPNLSEMFPEAGRGPAIATSSDGPSIFSLASQAK